VQLQGKVPLLRLVLPFIAGILLSQRVTDPGLCAWILPAGASVFLLFSLILFKVIPLPLYRFRWISGILIILLFTVAGFIRNETGENPSPDTGSAVNLPEDREILMLGIVMSSPQQKEKSVALPLKVFAYRCYDTLYTVDAQVMVYIPKDSPKLPAGFDTLALLTTVQLITNPGNPCEFDYAAYMQQKGFRHRAFVKEGKYISLAHGSPGLMKRFINDTRTALQQRVFISGMHEKNKGLGLAMVLGEKAFLDEDVQQGFSVSGTIHVLCVSGLHAGVIFLLISAFTGWLRRFGKPGKVLFVLISAAGLWAYAALTGLTPSVCRASVMFSMILAGHLISRKVNTLNNVAGAALILLVYDPVLLFDMGFQLSFLAVAGIVLLFNPLSGIWSPANRILKYIRDMAGVSLSAQLFTVPVTLAAFGTFPVWFLLANLVVIPLTGITLYAGVAFAIAPEGFFTMVTGRIFDLLLTLIRSEVDIISHMPLAQIQGIQVTGAEKILLFGVVISLAVWVNMGSRKVFLLMLAGVVILLASSASKIFYRHQQQEIVVYNLRGQTLADIITGTSRTTIWFGKSYDEKKTGYAAGGYRIRTGTLRNAGRHKTLMGKPGEVLQVSSPAGRIIFLDRFPDNGFPIRKDDIVVVRNRLYPVENVFDRYQPRLWLLDGSVPGFVAEKWLAIARDRKIPLWITAQQGAFRSSLHY